MLKLTFQGTTAPILLNERVWRAPTLETAGVGDDKVHPRRLPAPRQGVAPSLPLASAGAFRRRGEPAFGGGLATPAPGPGCRYSPQAEPPPPPSHARPASARAKRPSTAPTARGPAPAQCGKVAGAASSSGRAAAAVNMAAAGGRRWLLWAAGNRSGLDPGGRAGSGGLRRREKGRGERRATRGKRGKGALAASEAAGVSEQPRFALENTHDALFLPSQWWCMRWR